jgi:hypothetical protein
LNEASSGSHVAIWQRTAFQNRRVGGLWSCDFKAGRAVGVVLLMNNNNNNNDKTNLPHEHSN